MAFDVEGARKAGYTDAEIAEYLGEGRKIDAGAARRSGYTDAELVKELSAMPVPEEAAPADPYAIGNPMGDSAPVAAPGAPQAPGEGGGGLYLRSPTEARDWLRKQEADLRSWVSPPDAEGSGAGAGRAARGLVATLPTLALRAAQVVPNVLLGLGAGPGPAGTTINPETGTLGLTEEASAVASFGANPLGFSRGNPSTPAAVPQGTLNRTAPLSPEFKAAPMAPDLPARMPTERGPSTSTGLGVNEATVRPAPVVADDVAPGSVGAAGTPNSLSGLTPREEAAYRSTAEGQKWLERQEPGVPDRNTYVPGETANMVEVEQTVNAAREAKALGQKHPELGQDAKEIAFANNERRMQHFQRQAGSDVDLDLAKQARSRQAEADLAATWGNKTDADASPVMRTISEIEASPDWRRKAVKTAVNDVREEMVDGNGNLWTDPEQLYGVRKHIDDMLAKLDAAGKPEHARAQANLMQIKEALDVAIEAAAPGFRTYLDRFSEASRRIDAMEVLQAAERKLVDASGNMTFSRFQQFMKGLIDKRRAEGLAPEKSITEETMRELWNVRDSLRRVAGAQELARAAGSDTVQNLFTRVAGAAVPAAVQLGALAIAPGVGNVVAEMGRQGLMSRVAARRDAREIARGRTMQQNQLGPP